MAKVQRVRKKSTARIGRPEVVHQFLVVLSGTDPLVWRRIQVPEGYSFWDLHVAIQDAMGWLDYHLHEFRLLDAAKKRVVSIGIPTDEDPEDRPVIPGWKVRLSTYFQRWLSGPRYRGSNPCLPANSPSCFLRVTEQTPSAGKRCIIARGVFGLAGLESRGVPCVSLHLSPRH